MNIRPASKKDWTDIIKLVKSNSDKLMVTHLPKLSSFFVAEEEGEVVGCCALQVYSKRLAEVRSLAVAAKHRRNGIGSGLVRKCLRKAKQLKIHEVLAVSGSKEFFECLGFSTFRQEKYALLKILAR